MKCGVTIEYLTCRADLNFEVDFGVNGAIGAIVTKWDLFYSDNGSFSYIIYFFKYASDAFKVQYTKGSKVACQYCTTVL